MDAPAHLPRTEADLDDWSVYADHLLEIGDRRGELIAHDLALGALPTREEVAAFQARAKRLCPTHAEHVVPVWSLGFIRELHVRAARAMSMTPRYEMDSGTLGNARAVVHGDAARFLERFVIDIVPGGHDHHTRRLFAALPPTCTAVTFDVRAPIAAAQLAELVGWLPVHVRELEVEHRNILLPLAAADVLVTDRFDRVDVSRSAHGPMNQQPRGEPMSVEHVAHVAALGRAARVRLRIAVLPVGSLGCARLELGAPGDAAIVVPGHQALALRRYRLCDLQRTGRVVGIRAQLARTLREGYMYSLAQPYVTYGNAVMRHAGDRWTIVGGPAAISIDGVPLSDELGALADGATIVRGGVAARFFATDGERRAREALATSS